MARIATLKGTFLRPGVSKNGRKYTPENIGKAVTRMQKRLAEGMPIPMHTSHEANARGDVTATAAKITKVRQLPDGSATFEADVLDTPAGHAIRALCAPEDGKPALKTVSIFGKWVGPPKVDEDGNTTADDLDVGGIDFTHRPGVEGAQISDARLAEMLVSAGLFESEDGEPFAEEAGMASIVEAAPSPLALLIAEREHVFSDGACSSCALEGGNAPGNGAKPYGSVAYADPGYQADKKKRYPIDTAAHVRAALAYIGKGKNAAKYTAAQLKRIKSKIHAAAAKFGIDVSKESEMLNDLVERLGAEFADVLEAYASTSLDNGQGVVSVSAYTDDPQSLPKVGQAVARAALAGLLKLDPDNDGDVDIDSSNHAAPPSDEDDSDDDAVACPSCGGLTSNANFCPSCGAPVPGAEEAPVHNQEASAMEFTAAQVQALVSSELDPAKTSYTAEEVAALVKPATEANALAVLAEALTAAVKPAPPVEDELTKARRLIAEAEAAAAARPATAADIAAALKESEERHKAELAAVRAEAIEAFRMNGGPRRQGLISGDLEQRLSESEIPDAKTLASMSKDELNAVIDKTLVPALGLPA